MGIVLYLDLVEFFFRNPASFIRKTEEGKTSKEEMIGNQREKALWLKNGVRKKRKPAESFPLERVFFQT